MPSTNKVLLTENSFPWTDEGKNFTATLQASMENLIKRMKNLINQLDWRFLETSPDTRSQRLRNIQAHDQHNQI